MPCQPCNENGRFTAAGNGHLKRSAKLTMDDSEGENATDTKNGDAAQKGREHVLKLPKKSLSAMRLV
jgi:hypothetical protein